MGAPRDPRRWRPLVSSAETARLRLAIGSGHLMLQHDEQRRDLPAAERIGERLEAVNNLLCRRQVDAERHTVRLDEPVWLTTEIAAVDELLGKAADRLDAYGRRHRWPLMCDNEPALRAWQPDLAQRQLELERATGDWPAERVRGGQR
jgi:hypothetical protein